MKFVSTIFLIFLFSFITLAQDTSRILAIADGREYTAQDLSPDIAEAWNVLPETLAKARKAMLDKQIENILIEREAAERGISANELVEREVTKKVSDPSETQIKAFYAENREKMGDATLDEVRKKIVNYLRSEPEKKLYDSFLAPLKKKFGVSYQKDITQNDLKPADMVAEVGERRITYKDFTERNGLVLYEYEADVFDQAFLSLTQAIDSALYSEEALAQGISLSDYVAREITDRMEVYSDAAQQKLQQDLREKLYKKYNVKFFIREPKAFVQNISEDDDPSRGSAAAKVSVVMFSDFECPACAAVYPILEDVLKEFGNNARLTVRDFPLVNTHENAFNAALAANAANKQGKFFEYKEILYNNQDALDIGSLKKYAARIGLDKTRFEADMNDPKNAEEIRKDMEEGKKYGITGTPTIFVNGIKVRALSAKAFRDAIKYAIANPLK